MEPDYAQVEKRENSPANFVLDALTKLKIDNPMLADLSMRSSYETAFGIFNHQQPDDPKVPWPLMSISPRETTTRIDPLEFRLEQFAENRVGEIFRMSFDQLIQFPRRDFLKVMEVAKRYAAKLDATGTRAMKDLESKLSQLGHQQNR